MARIVFLILFIFHTNFVVAETTIEDLSQFKNYVDELYEALNEDGNYIQYDPLFYAVVAHYNFLSDERYKKQDRLTIIDFSVSANIKRLYTIDLANKKFFYRTYVSHGKNTGNEFATNFSNIRHSNTSSIGVYLTAETYTGRHGLSLRLDGLDDGYNNNARIRAIVMHGAEYVSEEFIEKYGRLGRSWGCPAVSMELYDKIIPDIAEGSLIYAYFPETQYFVDSKLMQLDDAVTKFAEVNKANKEEDLVPEVQVTSL